MTHPHLTLVQATYDAPARSVVPVTSTLDLWLMAWGKAWDNGDAAAAANLFADDASYSTGPFEESIRGRAAMEKYWTTVMAKQKDSKAEIIPLAHLGDVGVAHLRATTFNIEAGRHEVLDGVMVLALDRDGRCTDLRGWWHRRFED